MGVSTMWEWVGMGNWVRNEWESEKMCEGSGDATQRHIYYLFHPKINGPISRDGAGH